ncbi:MAG: hypothetical protein ACI8YQ_004466 [Polaribacter sp.]|jgi:hypothetical protein
MNSNIGFNLYYFSITQKIMGGSKNSRKTFNFSNNKKLTSRFGNDYVNQNDHRESGLYNRFHQRNREIIFCVILI